MSSSAPQLPQRPSGDQALASGSVLAQRYHVVSELGRGGMGVVYKARDLKLNRLVALKMMLTPTQANEEARARFEREAQAVALLQHPNIIQVHDVGLAGGSHYFILEYLAGGTLAQRLQEQPVSATVATKVAEVLARGIQSAHDKGIIHRDLKPCNVLLVEDASTPLEECTLKISDFGLARHLHRSTVTTSGAIVGTPAYMAPEQVEGKPSAIGPATDVYALGVILYEMLTGKPPFVADSLVALIYQILNRDPLSIRKASPQTPPELEQICLKCLQKTPENRFLSSAELAKALYRFLTNGTPPELPPTAVAKPNVAKPSVAKVTVAKPVSRSTVQTKQKTAVEPQTAQAITTNRQPHRKEKNVRRKKTTHPALILFVVLSLVGLAGYLAWHFLDKSNAIPVPQQANAVSTSTPPDVIRVDAPQTKKEENPSAPVTGGHADATPEGSRDHQAPDADVKVGEPAKPQWRITSQLTGHKAYIRAIAVSPDGRLVLTGSWDKTAAVWDLQQKKRLFSLNDHSSELYAVAFSADGRKMLTGSWDGVVKMWDTATGVVIFTVKAALSGILGVAFSPDGKRFATVSADVKCVLWDAITRRPLRSLDGHQNSITSVSFSSNGRYLLTTSWDGTAKVWDVNFAREIRTFRGHEGYVWCARFSPDGRFIVTGGEDKTVRVWNASTGQELFMLTGHIAPVFGVTFNRDGSQLLSGSLDSTARVWDVATRQELFVLLGHKVGIGGVGWSFEDKCILTGSVDATVGVWEFGK